MIQKKISKIENLEFGTYIILSYSKIIDYIEIKNHDSEKVLKNRKFRIRTPF